MKTSKMKLGIIHQLRHQNAAQKNKAPEHLNRPTKRSTKGFYMFVSQKNKLIEDVFPDGDVLHIERITGENRHGQI